MYMLNLLALGFSRLQQRGINLLTINLLADGVQSGVGLVAP